MELDDMKLAWQSLEQRLDQRLASRYALDLQRYREQKIGSARVRLLPTQLGLVVRMLLGVATIVLSASFWVAHLGAPNLVVCGVLLQAYGILLVASAAWEMQLLVGIDYAGPVLAIQQGLARFASWRVKLTPVWMVTGCFVWIPLVLVAFKAGLGADLYARAPEVVVWFVVSGFVAWAAFWAIGRWIPGAARGLGESSIGGSVKRAQRQLDELARFAAE